MPCCYLLHTQQRQYNDNSENGKETAGTITAATATMSTTTVVFIEGLHIVGITRTAFTKIAVVFRHDVTSFQFVLKMLLFS